MKHLYVSLFLFLSFISYSQNTFNSEDFTVTKGDIETNSYKKDSTAHALVIYEMGNSYIDRETYELRTEIKRKVKILDRNGFEEANIAIDLYSNEKVYNIKASSHNVENNEIITTTLSEDQMFSTEHGNFLRVKFTLPNIKIGSVITYSYILETPSIFKYRGWAFQSLIPTLHSEYRASIPGNYVYNIKLTGGKKLFKNESTTEENCLSSRANCFNSIYVMKDVPAFIEEEFMTAKKNYLIRIDYELKTLKRLNGYVKNYTKTWETTDKELKTNKNIGKQLNKGGFVKNLLPQEIIEEPNSLLKAKDILQFVQKEYNWNKGYNLFGETSLKELIKVKSGYASEINLLLFNLLKEQGIDVKIVLISTRKNGFATKVYPVLSDFNYLVVQATIDGKTYLLDGTTPYLTFGQLPFKCLNQYGRLLDFKNGSSWIPIKANSKTTKVYRAQVTFNDLGILEGNVKSKKTGYHAIKTKQNYHYDTEKYLKAYKDTNPSLNIVNHNVSTIEKNSNTFEETFNISITPEIIGKNTYLNPFLFKHISENPFKLQERTYPIDFGYKEVYLYNFKVNLNGKYDVVELPENISLKLPDNSGTLLLNVKQDEDSIMVFFKFSLAEAIYPSEFYSHLKSFFSYIVQAQNNSFIILKEK